MTTFVHKLFVCNYFMKRLIYAMFILQLLLLKRTKLKLQLRRRMVVPR